MKKIIFCLLMIAGTVNAFSQRATGKELLEMYSSIDSVLNSVQLGVVVLDSVAHAMDAAADPQAIDVLDQKVTYVHITLAQQLDLLAMHEELVPEWQENISNQLQLLQILQERIELMSEAASAVSDAVLETETSKRWKTKPLKEPCQALAGINASLLSSQSGITQISWPIDQAAFIDSVLAVGVEIRSVCEEFYALRGKRTKKMPVFMTLPSTMGLALDMLDLRVKSLRTAALAMQLDIDFRWYSETTAPRQELELRLRQMLVHLESMREYLATLKATQSGE